MYPPMSKHGINKWVYSVGIHRYICSINININAVNAVSRQL